MFVVGMFVVGMFVVGMFDVGMLEYDRVIFSGFFCVQIRENPDSKEDDFDCTQMEFRSVFQSVDMCDVSYLIVLLRNLATLTWRTGAAYNNCWKNQD